MKTLSERVSEIFDSARLDMPRSRSEVAIRDTVGHTMSILERSVARLGTLSSSINRSKDDRGKIAIAKNVLKELSLAISEIVLEDDIDDADSALSEIECAISSIRESIRSVR